MAPFSTYLALVPNTRAGRLGPLYSKKNHNIRHLEKSSFSSTSEFKSSTKNPASFRHFLSVSLVWILFSFHLESSFLESVLNILLSSQETACCCLLRLVRVLRIYYTGHGMISDIETIEDGEVIRKLLPITGIQDNPAVCRLSVFVDV